MVLLQGMQGERWGEVHPALGRRGWVILSVWLGRCVSVYIWNVHGYYCEKLHVHVCVPSFVCLCECRGSVWCGKSLGVSSCHRVLLCECCLLLSPYQRFWSWESGPHHISDLTQCAAQGQRPNSVNFCHSLDRLSLQMEAW